MTEQAILDAAARLEAGALVAFPTETVYGLGADAENPAAVAAIYAAKGRPQDHPVIVHVAPGADLDYWAADVPDEARKLARAFWPGPLTMIVKRHAHIPDAVSGGQDTVGIRCPSHPVAMALLAAFKGGKGGVAAPSANKFGNVSPTTAQHVRDEFNEEFGAGAMTVLDGGASQVGIESTIVDLSRLATHGPVLLRPGHIGAAEIAAVIGAMPAAPDAAAPRASGTLESHYAPKAPVALADTARLPSLLTTLAGRGRHVAVIRYSPMLVQASAQELLPNEPAGYAFGLYAALRTMDRADVELILVETPPQHDAWLGINDRLRRAAFGSAGIIDRFLTAE
ncbi:L-threonylcarbamoyladenylate synthase [Pseudoduganella sp. SL102]|uniref:L-threonylcarbamoyladenylate synthase n=1 Tax=Pseudoduganella sp. SL102 TaxID=2995154 RepID=UPI00248B3935|nr:L-threonylcarbamoyladenylate synthase [Pseudoduganella sp. SL102]WBS02446.1 L-threonylcarbamoyladenylate synthase [Pseudoduganella sp. SL102]